MKFFLCVFFAFITNAFPATVTEQERLVTDSIPASHFTFTALVGERIDANQLNWLLTAPQANPGMLEMFRLRDREPAPQLVPWAGEFVGKYLISAVQALRLTEDRHLFLQVSNVVAEFIATQAEDGYLGPFPKKDRLLKNWDLWGHYHTFQALVLWTEHTGNLAALAAARKAADLVCRTYLDTGRHVFDAGDPEMNMSILTGLAMLYRLTGEPTYLRMVREIEKDWERAGDYLRAGLDGREYFQSPRPRWESLHDLQGLVELWRITGESKYREALIHHWRSIRRWDRRNTGAFSSGEQATGNPFAPTAIETCCTVAWMALTLDYLRVTGDPRAADDLELSTVNGGLGAQHPSGRWWTYNTPMDGVREASAHTIVFQARAGTPELNCCSVNGPRVLGLLSEWAVMDMGDGLAVNSYLPGTFILPGPNQEVRLKLDRDYPRSDSQQVSILAAGDMEWTLRLRIPAWSRNTRIRANFSPAPTNASPGSYLEIRRFWKADDEVELNFDFKVRAVAGANEAAGKVSLYRGPLLLAYDQAQNSFDEKDIPPVNLGRLNKIRVVGQLDKSTRSHSHPWLQVHLPADNGRDLRLVDFASAGANGTRYRSWLPVAKSPPPPAFTQYPRDGEQLRPAFTSFQWRGPRTHKDVRYRVEIATDPDFSKVLLTTNGLGTTRTAMDLEGLPLHSNHWWRVVTVGANGETVPDVPAACFSLNVDAPAQRLPPEIKTGPDGALALHSLRAAEAPKFGQLLSAKVLAHSAEGTQVNGHDQMLVYSVPAWPEEDFTMAVRVRIDEMPTGRMGQIFSAWTASMDDPLRLVVNGGKVSARVESGGGFATPEVSIEAGRWHRIAAVKQGTTLSLYLDGTKAGSCAVPEFATTAARHCALGGNPHFGGNEFLAATFADFGLWARPLSDEEVRDFGGNHTSR